jgi:hypothetical protein
MSTAASAEKVMERTFNSRHQKSLLTSGRLCQHVGFAWSSKPRLSDWGSKQSVSDHF